MRILVISNLFPPDIRGGYEILCEQVSSELQALGHEIQVLTTGKADREIVEFPVERDLRLYLTFSEPARFARSRRWLTTRHNYARTRSAIVRFSPDVIFIWSQLRLTVGCSLAAERGGVPVAYTMNDEYLLGYTNAKQGWKSSLKRFLDSSVLSITADRLQLRHVTCISELLKRRMCAQGLPLENAEVIYQGIPTEKFYAKAEPGGIGATPRILYAGQLHEYKGVHTLIEAVSKLSGGGCDLEVTICGAGDASYERRLAAMAKDSSARILFPGRVTHDRLPRIYREHDILVFPSTWAEPFGLTHLEAMACGTTVISTTEGGQGEFLRDGVNCLTFPAGGASDLAARLATLINDKALSARLAAAALQQVRSQFSLVAYAKRLNIWLTGIVQAETRCIEKPVDAAATAV